MTMFDTPKFQIFFIFPVFFFDFTIHIGCMAPESSYAFLLLILSLWFS
uniref:Uncharacterized protein n=1 Tax=Aegilops tauschii subsp. strangulata TaxID=200361 RepID=A0A453BW29_AEGTS